MKKRIEELENMAKNILSEVAEIKAKISKTKLSDLKPGDEFQMAGRTFIVLDSASGETAVISKDFWGDVIKFGESSDYKTSTVKRYLDENVLPKLEEAVGAENIVEHWTNLRSVDGKNEFGKFSCKVRLMTFDEVRKYTDYIKNKDLPDWWWTCTPWSSEGRGWKYSVAVVSPAGFIGRISCDSCNGVRPFCILKSDLFVSGK